MQNLKIPVPSLERQKEIVEYCEYNDTLIKQLEKELNESGLRLIEKEGPYFMPWPIRAADWFLSQRFPKLCFLFYPFIYISDFFSRFKFFRKNGSLIAAIVVKD